MSKITQSVVSAGVFGIVKTNLRRPVATDCNPQTATSQLGFGTEVVLIPTVPPAAAPPSAPCQANREVKSLRTRKPDQRPNRIGNPFSGVVWTFFDSRLIRAARFGHVPLPGTSRPASQSTNQHHAPCVRTNMIRIQPS